MATDETRGPGPHGENSPVNPSGDAPSTDASPHAETGSDLNHSSYEPHADDPYHHYDDPYAEHAYQAPATTEIATVTPPPVQAGSPPPPPFKEDKKEAEDDDDEGMLRMSFLEHLEELRTRILNMLWGLVIAFLACFWFKDKLWLIVSGPAYVALTRLGYPPELVQINPMDTFTVVWMKVPLLLSLFVASPWILYQVWGFIAPGLYKKEKRMAAPFILTSAGLFMLGGLFAYFVAFRFGLEFLLGVGKDINIKPQISIVDYSDLFFNVILGVSLVFEMPVVIFFLAMLRIVSAKFLLEHSRYAILGITILAAFITPTPDAFNMMLFALPMVGLYFVGVFAAYLLEHQREHNRFPWMAILLLVTTILAIAGGIVAFFVFKYGYKLIPYWPFMIR